MNYYINVMRGLHEGGTKFYDIYALMAVDPDQTTEEKQIVVIQNWGKTGSIRSGVHKLSGQYKIKMYGKREHAANADTAGIRVSKERRGYAFEGNKCIFADSNASKFIYVAEKLGLDFGQLLEIYKSLIPDFAPEATIDTSKSFNEKSAKPKPVNNDPLWGTW